MEMVLAVLVIVALIGFIGMPVLAKITKLGSSLLINVIKGLFVIGVVLFAVIFGWKGFLAIGVLALIGLFATIKEVGQKLTNNNHNNQYQEVNQQDVNNTVEAEFEDLNELPDHSDYIEELESVNIYELD